MRRFAKAINLFAKAEKILAIISIVAASIGILVSLISGIFNLVNYINTLNSSSTTEPDAQTLSLVLTINSLIMALFVSPMGLVFSIVSLCLITNVIENYPKVKSRKQATPYGVKAIVAGVLGIGFGIPAGVLILCTRVKDYEEGQPKQEPVVAQEVVDVEVNK